MNRIKRVMQFAHPGGEHGVTRNNTRTTVSGQKVKLWNHGAHARKYLRNPVHFVDGLRSDGAWSTNAGVMDFWGEWEPESMCLPLQATTGHYSSEVPRFVHSPFYTDATKYPNARELQNTDPFVFGDRFYYTICKQSFTKNLDVGSIILFGSVRKGYGKFLVDTVFVVKNIISSNREMIEQFGDNPLLYQCVLHKIHHGQGANPDEDIQHLIFEGATYEDDYNGMFSFFPCSELSAIGRPRFEIDENFHEKVSTILQNTNNVIYGGTDNEIKQVWLTLANHALNQGYCLGHKAEAPPYIPEIEDVLTNRRILGV